MMLHNASTSNPVRYGIIKERSVVESIKQIPFQFREEIYNAIDALQSNPRPVGHEPTNFGPYPAINFVVGSSSPQHKLVCAIDDEKEKVYVMAIYEIRFSSTGRHSQVSGNQLNKLDLLNLLDKSFDTTSLREICLATDVEYENLEGSGKRAKALALIKHCQRDSSLAKEFIGICQRMYPQAAWAEYLPLLTES